MVKLAIGMATYNDYDGIYFALQSLRMDQNLDDVELLVVDNHGCEHTDALFSKHRFMEGSYSAEDAQHLDLRVIRNYCLALSLLSREELVSIR